MVVQQVTKRVNGVGWHPVESQSPPVQALAATVPVARVLAKTRHRDGAGRRRCNRQQGVAVYKVPKGKQPLVGRWTGLGSDGEVRNETLTKIKPGDEKQAVSRPTNFWSFFETDRKSH